MPTLEELLSASTNGTEVCIIEDETRKIFIPDTLKLFGVESDEKAERIYFKCKKIVGDNIDLSQLRLYVNYRNANSEDGSYIVTDVDTFTDENYIYFSWLLSRTVTMYKGTVQFIICAKKVDEGGALTNEWNTTIAQSIVLEGLEVEVNIPAAEMDVLTQLLQIMEVSSVKAETNANRAAESVTEAYRYAEQSEVSAQKAINAIVDMTDQVEEAKKQAGIATTKANESKESATTASQELTKVQSASTKAQTDITSLSTMKQTELTTHADTKKGEITTEGIKQLGLITAKGTEQVSAVGTKGAEQVKLVGDTGTTKVNDITAEGIKQVGLVNTKGTDKINELNTTTTTRLTEIASEGAKQTKAVTDKGTSEIARVETEGIKQVNLAKAEVTKATTQATKATEQATKAETILSDTVQLDKVVLTDGSITVPNTYESNAVVELVKGATYQDADPTPTDPKPILGIGSSGYFDGELLQGYYNFDTGEFAVNTFFVCNKNRMKCNSNDIITGKVEKKVSNVRSIIFTFYTENGNFITTVKSAEGKPEFTYEAPNFAVFFNISVQYYENTTITNTGHICVTVNSKYAVRIKTESKDKTKQSEILIPIEYPLYDGDSIQLIDGKYVVVRNNAEIVFDGSADEVWGMYKQPNNSVLSLTTYSDKYKIGFNTSKTNRFANVIRAWDNNDVGVYSDHDIVNNKYFRYTNDVTFTVEKWKTWLQTNNLKMVYKIASPTYTQIDERNQKLLYGLRTYGEQTTIQIVDELKTNGTFFVAKNEQGQYVLDGYSLAKTIESQNADPFEIGNASETQSGLMSSLDYVKLKGIDLSRYALTTQLPTKASLQLSNVDNTSDANKPISSATQTALNAKANNTTVTALQTEVGTKEQKGKITQISYSASGTDLNDIVSIGYYVFGSNDSVSTMLNTPFGQNSFALIVMDNVGFNLPNYKTQVAFSYQGHMAIRALNNGNWEGWTNIYSEINKPTPTDIGLSNVPNVTTNNQVPTFTVPTTRANIVSGETLTTMLGKLSKWYSSFGTSAFANVINNLTATVGGSPLDATMGKKLNDEKEDKGKITHIVVNTNGVNINNYRTTGYYNFSPNDIVKTMLNTPFGELSFALIVVDTIGRNEAFKVQIAFNYLTSEMAIRTLTSNTWGGWSNVYSTNKKPTKADIADFPTSMPASDVSAWAKASTKPTYTKAEVGLSNVDNTSDANKSVSIAQKNAIDLKANTTDLTSHTGNKSNPHSVTKLQVGLGNVDNTADAQKNVATALRATSDKNGNQIDTTYGTIGNVSNRMMKHYLITIPKAKVISNCFYDNGVAHALLQVDLPKIIGKSGSTDYRKDFTVLSYCFYFGSAGEYNYNKQNISYGSITKFGAGLAGGCSMLEVFPETGILQLDISVASSMDDTLSNFKANMGDLEIIVAETNMFIKLTG